jgi:hypothetical protein
MNSVHLKLTSAVALGGQIFKAGSIVEVGEDIARDILNRGKAEVATVADAPECGDEQTETGTDEQGAAADAQPAAAPKPSRKK